MINLIEVDKLARGIKVTCPVCGSSALFTVGFSGCISTLKTPCKHLSVSQDGRMFSLDFTGDICINYISSGKGTASKTEAAVD